MAGRDAAHQRDCCRAGCGAPSHLLTAVVCWLARAAWVGWLDCVVRSQVSAECAEASRRNVDLNEALEEEAEKRMALEVFFGKSYLRSYLAQLKPPSPLRTIAPT